MIYIYFFTRLSSFMLLVSLPALRLEDKRIFDNLVYHLFSTVQAWLGNSFNFTVLNNTKYIPFQVDDQFV